jgi:hypothetical protein
MSSLKFGRAKLIVAQIISPNANSILYIVCYIGLSNFILVVVFVVLFIKARLSRHSQQIVEGP